MKNRILYLMCGVPGSGKSHWVAERVKRMGGAHISRDAIRFAMLKDDDDYFAKEKQVFNEFIAKASLAIKNPEISHIYLDATHINEDSRQKTLNSLRQACGDALNDWELIIVYMDTPTATCVERNDTRTGRAFVPRSVIRRMGNQLVPPDERIYNVMTIKDGVEDGKDFPLFRYAF